MAKCARCDCDGLRWHQVLRGFILIDEWDSQHQCRQEDLNRVRAKREKELVENEAAKRKYRDEAGYL